MFQQLLQFALNYHHLYVGIVLTISYDPVDTNMPQITIIPMQVLCRQLAIAGYVFQYVLNYL
jgi:hypothetical protein